MNTSKFNNITWYQNIEQPKVEPLTLTATYDPDIYQKFDNYDAIDVGTLKNIPKDYFGVMGVPVTIFSKHNPEQFELVGCPCANVLPDGWKGMTKEFLDLFFGQGNTGHFTVGNRNPYYITKQGKAVCPYTRILIRRIVPKETT